jgi:hypothetical protein
MTGSDLDSTKGAVTLTVQLVKAGVAHMSARLRS